MREIKFRGKRVDNGEWVYGDLLEPFESHYYVLDYSKFNYDCFEDIGLFGEDFEVIPETVGQLTGLFDKNGKQIYEGDIVNWGIDGREKPTRIAQVMFKPDIIFNSSVGIFNYGDFAYQDTYNHLTIIGNIHDNPKLLEVPNA